MCQSHVSANDSEKKDGSGGRSARQRPDFTEEAGDQWISRLHTPALSTTTAFTHTCIQRTQTNTSGWSLTQRLTYEEPVGKIKNICDSGTDKHSGVRWKTCKFKASTTSVSSLTTFRANFNSRPSMSLSCWRKRPGDMSIKMKSLLWVRIKLKHTWTWTHTVPGTDVSFWSRDRGWSTHRASNG